MTPRSACRINTQASITSWTRKNASTVVPGAWTARTQISVWSATQATCSPRANASTRPAPPTNTWSRMQPTQSWSAASPVLRAAHPANWKTHKSQPRSPTSFVLHASSNTNWQTTTNARWSLKTTTRRSHAIHSSTHTSSTRHPTCSDAWTALADASIAISPPSVTWPLWNATRACLDSNWTAACAIPSAISLRNTSMLPQSRARFATRAARDAPPKRPASNAPPTIRWWTANARRFLFRSKIVALAITTTRSRSAVASPQMNSTTPHWTSATKSWWLARPQCTSSRRLTPASIARPRTALSATPSLPRSVCRAQAITTWFPPEKRALPARLLGARSARPPQHARPASQDSINTRPRAPPASKPLPAWNIAIQALCPTLLPCTTWTRTSSTLVLSSSSTVIWETISRTRKLPQRTPSLSGWETREYSRCPGPLTNQPSRTRNMKVCPSNSNASPASITVPAARVRLFTASTTRNATCNAQPGKCWRRRQERESNIVTSQSPPWWISKKFWWTPSRQTWSSRWRKSNSFSSSPQIFRSFFLFF